MKKVYVVSLAALLLAAVLGIGLQDSFAGPWGGRGMPLDRAQVKELRQLQRDMEDKCFEMMDLFAEKSVDANKAKALQRDMQTIREKIGSFWLNAALAYKQAHPDWTPGFGGMGMMGGMGMGMGMMGGGMMGGMGMGRHHGGYYNDYYDDYDDSQSAPKSGAE